MFVYDIIAVNNTSTQIYDWAIELLVTKSILFQANFIGILSSHVFPIRLFIQYFHFLLNLRLWQTPSICLRVIKLGERQKVIF